MDAWIRTLSEAFAPSGLEQEAKAVVMAQAKRLGLTVEQDRLGNLLIPVKGKRKPDMPLYLSAHLDEPGMMLKGAQDGVFKFGLTGNTEVRNILGRQVLAGKEKRRGVIGLKPIHLTEKEEREKLPKQEELYIDLGGEFEIQKGDYAVFGEPFLPLGDNAFLGKAMSRGVTAGTLLALMAEPLPVDVTFLFTVQRHVGSRGAYAAGAGISEGTVIVLDLCPGKRGGETLPQLGKGPVIPQMDQGAIYDGALQRALHLGAERRNVPVQPWASLPGKGDGAVYQRSQAGLRTGALLCPAELIKAPGQLVWRSDTEAMTQVLLGFMEGYAV